MIGEEGNETYSKHCRNKKYKQNMEFPSQRCIPISTPKVNKVPKRKCKNDQTVEESITQEKNEKLVVIKTDAIVHLKIKKSIYKIVPELRIQMLKIIRITYFVFTQGQ